MAFHGLKFECLKFGDNKDLSEEYDYIDSSGSNSIKDAQNVRDLGIYMDANGTFEYHIYKAISKAKKLCGCISRSFINRSIDLRRKLWRSYVEPVLDYGSQLYCPINLTLISNLEAVQRNYTHNTENMQLHNYWERLALMKLNSVQRRQERYRIIYIFKILQNLVPNPGIKFDTNCTRGQMIILPPIKTSHSTKAVNMREQSLWCHGGKLFNALPINIRNCTDSLDIFKKNLDSFLCKIPDHPATPDLAPEPINPITCRNSNLLVDWINFLKIGNRRIYTDMQGL